MARSRGTTTTPSPSATTNIAGTNQNTADSDRPVHGFKLVSAGPEAARGIPVNAARNLVHGNEPDATPLHRGQTCSACASRTPFFPTEDGCSRNLDLIYNISYRIHRHGAGVK
jgi:hypothetical protein